MLIEFTPHVCTPGKHPHVFNPGAAPIVHVVAVRDKNGVIGSVGGDGGNAVIPETIDNPPVNPSIASCGEARLRDSVKLSGVTGDNKGGTSSAGNTRQAPQNFGSGFERCARVRGDDARVQVRCHQARHLMDGRPPGAFGNAYDNIYNIYVVGHGVFISCEFERE